MAQPSQPSASWKWDSETVKMLVGKTPKLDPQTGEHLRGGKNKALQYDRKSSDVKYEFPVLNAKMLKDTSDIQFALEEILEAKKPGFASLEQLIDHLNHGLKRSPAVQMNQGKDLRLSPSQLQAITTLVSSLKQGYLDFAAEQLGMSGFDFVVASLTKQGIPDAEKEVRLRLIESEEDEETSES